MNNRRFYQPSLLSDKWVPNPSQVRVLDQQTAEGINGDDGGLWSPSNKIVIGGSGVQLTSLGGFSGGVATGKYAPAGSLRLGDSDYPIHQTPKTRKVFFPIRDVFCANFDINQTLFGGFSSSAYDQSVPGILRGTDDNILITSTFLDLKYFYLAATISEVKLRFSVGLKPATVPVNLPSFYLATQAFAEQQFMPTPADVDAYYNKGLPQSIILNPATLTTVTATDYAFQISDSSATRNSYHSVAITFTNIVDMQPGQ